MTLMVNFRWWRGPFLIARQSFCGCFWWSRWLSLNSIIKYLLTFRSFSLQGIQERRSWSQSILNSYLLAHCHLQCGSRTRTSWTSSPIQKSKWSLNKSILWSEINLNFPLQSDHRVPAKEWQWYLQLLIQAAEADPEHNYLRNHSKDWQESHNRR